MKNSAGLGVLAAVLAVSACGGESNPGGLTAEDSRQLNEAANMLETSPDSLTADETGLGNAAANGVEDEQTGAMPVSGEDANGQ